PRAVPGRALARGRPPRLERGSRADVRRPGRRRAGEPSGRPQPRPPARGAIAPLLADGRAARVRRRPAHPGVVGDPDGELPLRRVRDRRAGALRPDRPPRPRRSLRARQPRRRSRVRAGPGWPRRAARELPRNGGAAASVALVQSTPGPGSRPPTPRSRLRSSRRRAARRRGFVAFLVAVLVFIGWAAWPRGGGAERAGGGGSHRGNGGHQGGGSPSASPSSSTLPGSTPIKHVVF